MKNPKSDYRSATADETNPKCKTPNSKRSGWEHWDFAAFMLV
jgi:hypothetical protein